MTRMQAAWDVLTEMEQEHKPVARCVFCGDPLIEIHHVYGRANSKLSGEILFVDLFPLCKKHHAEDLRGEKFFEQWNNIRYNSKKYSAEATQRHVQRCVAKVIKIS